MARGKHTCKILKEIRRQIAQANDIDLITSECKYQGDCAGTCPKCEAEVRFLENELSRRRALGKAVVLTGLSAGLIGLTSCTKPVQQAAQEAAQRNEATEQCCEIPTKECEVPEQDTISHNSIPENITELLIVGDIAVNEENTECIEEQGELPPADTNDVGTSENKESVKNDTPKTDLIKLTGEEVIAPLVEDESIPLKDRVYSIVFTDKKPSFPGGSDSLEAYFQKNITYPPDAIADKAEGRVVVEFIVEPTGELTNIRIVRSRHPALDKEAVRIIETMPKFIPGERNGRKVRTIYVLPVPFSMPEETPSDSICIEKTEAAE